MSYKRYIVFIAIIIGLAALAQVQSGKASYKAALAISPKTPVEHLFPFIGHIDMALIMTVEPGFGGQSLIPETLEKVSVLRKYVSERGINLDIEVDGGINADNVGLLTSAGANIIVAGSAIFKAKKPKQVIQDMKDAAVKNPFIG